MNAKTLILMPDANQRLQIMASYPPEDYISPTAAAAAEWAWHNKKIAGKNSNTLASSEWLFFPLKTANDMIGTLGIQIEERNQTIIADQQRLIETLADQAAVALERTKLASDFAESRVMIEADQLRASILSSISRDLRNPLVSIRLNVASLLHENQTASAEKRQIVLEEIQDEAEELNHFLQNILDITKFGTGALTPRTENQDPGEILRAALERLKRHLSGREVKVDIEPGLPLLPLDFTLMEHAIINILDNAIKYTPAGSPIDIDLKDEGHNITLTISDYGLGIPEHEREHIFDMFYRVKNSAATKKSGAGIGLAVSKAIIEAHGGTISAATTKQKENTGTSIEIKLPVLIEDSTVSPAEA